MGQRGTLFERHPHVPQLALVALEHAQERGLGLAVVVALHHPADLIRRQERVGGPQTDDEVDQALRLGSGHVNKRYFPSSLMRRSTRGSSLANGSVSATVGSVPSATLRWTQSTVKSRPASRAAVMNLPRNAPRVESGAWVRARSISSPL